jgi:hypothetical protein
MARLNHVREAFFDLMHHFPGDVVGAKIKCKLICGPVFLRIAIPRAQWKAFRIAIAIPLLGFRGFCGPAVIFFLTTILPFN